MQSHNDACKKVFFKILYLTPLEILLTTTYLQT